MYRPPLNNTFTTIITDSFSEFAEKIISQIPFDVSDLQLDHFGYQTSSSQDYESLKETVLEIGDLVSEESVGERRVGIFRFKTPLQWKQYSVLGFELVEPKEGQACESELDHIEFVITTSFDEYIENHNSERWDLRAKDREMFPKIVLLLEDNKSVKFHTSPIFDEVPS